MGKKKATNTEIEGKAKSKASWPDDLVEQFCDIAVKEVAKRNRPGTRFDKVGWANVIKAFKELTGRDYNKQQLKNKWDSLKGDWRLWTSLLRQETGIGWDPSKKTVDASSEWWDKKIMENEDFRKFREVGISPEMMEKYDQMFKGSTALGDSVMIPSASINVEEIVEDSENAISAHNGENPELVQSKQNRGKKRVTMDKETGAGKDNAILGEGKREKEKVGGAAKLAKQIDRLVDVVESRSTATSIPSSAQGTSIQDVMQVVDIKGSLK